MIIWIIQDINKVILPCLSKEVRASTSRASSAQPPSPLDPDELELAAAAGGAPSCGGFCEVQVVEDCIKCCVILNKGTFKKQKKAYFFGKNIPPEALQWLGGDVLLLHHQPLPHRAVRLLCHFPLVVGTSLRVSLKSLVQAVPLPHLQERKWPEAALPINGSVYIDLEVAGDLWKQLHIP